MKYAVEIPMTNGGVIYVRSSKHGFHFEETLQDEFLFDSDAEAQKVVDLFGPFNALAASVQGVKSAPRVIEVA